MRCVITGYALATSQGVDARSTLRNLLDGRILRDTGRVPLARDLSLPRVSQLAIQVASAALAEAGWSRNEIGCDRTALLIGTSKGPIEAWIAGEPTSAFGLAAVAADVAAAVGHGDGPRLTSAAACASGLHALIRARQLLVADRCDRAIVVAAESSTGPLFRATFDRLGVLARPEVGCRPFDRDREGFLLAEAAAAVCLQRLTDAPTKGVILEAGIIAADAHHLTAPDPSGDVLASVVGRVTGDARIEVLHAHGTGTALNDAMELDAISRALPPLENRTPTLVVSHKHAIGHTQGAAGLIAVVLNTMMHQHGRVFGNANTTVPLKARNVLVATQPCDRAIRTSLVLAAGFGGPVAAVRLASIQ